MPEESSIELILPRQYVGRAMASLLVFRLALEGMQKEYNERQAGSGTIWTAESQINEKIIDTINKQTNKIKPDFVSAEDSDPRDLIRLHLSKDNISRLVAAMTFHRQELHKNYIRNEENVSGSGRDHYARSAFTDRIIDRIQQQTISSKPVYTAHAVA